METMQETKDRKNKKKTSKPKTKTGCKTCRKRRVKCDEHKPNCLRCSNHGRFCEGYADSDSQKAQNIPTTTTQRVILPKIAPFTTHYLPRIPKIQRKLNGGFRFQNLQEKRYFLLFQEEIAVELSGGFQSGVWNRIVLQACENPSIRQLTVAVAALKQAKRVRDPNFVPDAQNHLEYALQQYGKALRGLQRAYSGGKNRKHLRMSLIAALLIFCFENMQGNISRAFNNVQSAVGLIPSQLLSDSKEIHALPVESGRIPSSIPGLVEDEVLGQFIRLDRPGVVFFCPSIQGNFSQLSKFHLDVRPTPTTFSSFEEARYHYEVLRYRLPVAEIGPLFRKPVPVPNTPNAAAIMTRRMIIGAVKHETGSELVCQYRLWQKAFLCFQERSKMIDGGETLLPQMVLQTQSLLFDIMIMAGYSTQQPNPRFPGPIEPSRSAELSFRILNLAEDITAHPNFSKSFVFDIGIIPLLWIMMVVSPVPEVRARTIQILRDMRPRVEGVWDSRSVVAAGEEYLKLLEAGIDIDP